VYWQGGDGDIENVLYSPNAFDRVVVWGSPETVAAVQSRSLYTRTICLNPRYGVSLIGREAFADRLEEAALKASMDSLIHNQKACTSSLVHYIEGTEEQADRYAGLLCRALRKWDRSIPQFISPAVRGQLKRLKRGKYASGRWYINAGDEQFFSGAVVMPDEFDILDHPMCRLVIVRPVSNLADALRYLHPGVSTAGIYPEERRTALRDRILARGVSSVFPLGECERLYAGMPHDGLPVLSHLVDWKNG
ncbi:MAG: acyl-CoA reductase, partial [Dehalococcoidales bacterium]|nr:acyl-CoA reductase [Dehalococcoidales bacterium]